MGADTLLSWFRKQLSSYDCIAVNDMTFSFQDGLALCAVIHRYRPELIEFQALDPAAWVENCQLAFDVLEQDFGIVPVLSGKELAASKNPDKLTMISYLSQIYEVFRKEIPASKLKKLNNHQHQSDDDLLLEDSLLRHNCPPREHGGRRKNRGSSGTAGDANAKTIGQLVAEESSRRRKKRRSKEDSLDKNASGGHATAATAADDDVVMADEGEGGGLSKEDVLLAAAVDEDDASVPDNKENMKETARINR